MSNKDYDVLLVSGSDSVDNFCLHLPALEQERVKVGNVSTRVDNFVIVGIHAKQRLKFLCLVKVDVNAGFNIAELCSVVSKHLKTTISYRTPTSSRACLIFCRTTLGITGGVLFKLVEALINLKRVETKFWQRPFVSVFILVSLCTPWRVLYYSGRVLFWKLVLCCFKSV